MERFHLSWERREGWEPAAWQPLIQLFCGIIWSQNCSKPGGFRTTPSFLGCHIIWRGPFFLKLQICSNIKKGIWSLCLLHLSLVWPLKTLPLPHTCCKPCGAASAHPCAETRSSNRHVLVSLWLQLRVGLSSHSWLLQGWWAAHALLQCPILGDGTCPSSHLCFHTCLCCQEWLLVLNRLWKQQPAFQRDTQDELVTAATWHFQPCSAKGDVF